jgi:hypothetical protein
MHNTPEEIFIQEVPKAFSFLVSEYGFALTQRHDCLFEATSPQCIVSIGNDWPGFYVALAPTKKSWEVKPDTPMKQIGLVWIVHYSYPTLHYKEIHLRSVDQISRELRRQAEILKRYCFRFLKGDFSEWKKIVDFVDKGRTDIT